MKDGLPIWLQTLALFFLVAVFAVTVAWVEDQDHREMTGRSGIVANRVHGLLFVAMPLPVLFLGLRLICGLIHVLRTKPVNACAYWLLIFVMIPLVAALSIAPFTPLKQVSR